MLNISYELILVMSIALFPNQTLVLHLPLNIYIESSDIMIYLPKNCMMFTEHKQ